MNNIIYLNHKNNITYKDKFNNIPSFLKYNINRGIFFDYIFIDCNSIFIFPYIRYYEDINEISFKILSVVLYINKMYKDKKPKIVLSIDNGTSDKMKSILKYKIGRKTSAKKNIGMFNKTTTNEYNKLIGLILDLLTPLGIIIDVNKGEADFKVGFFIKNISNDNKNILVISSDNDYIGMAEYSDVLLKRKNFFLYIKKGDIYLSNLIPNELNLSSPFQYYFYKSLIGDRMDNIPRILTNKQAIKIINEFNRNNNNTKDPIEFMNFCKKYIDIDQLSKNLFMVIPFNEKAFDDNNELENIKIFFERYILGEIEYDIDKFIDRISFVRYGGKDFINNLINNIKKIYV